MKKKTQLERAIESLEAELANTLRDHQAERVSLDAKYHGRCEGLEASIKSLRHQQAAKPKRRAKLAAVPESKGA